MKSIVIIGGGQAATQAIISLRSKSADNDGFNGEIILIGEEPILPYQRPPLSKAYLKGEFDEQRLFFRPQAWYEDNNVTLMLGQRVEKINRVTKTVGLSGGREVAYDKLIIATGTRPRPLPDSIIKTDISTIFELRTINDVDKIRTHMKPNRRLLIIGAGYIGLEAAAVARKMGLEVTIVEMAERVLARVTGEVMSQFYEEMHSQEGVKILTNNSVTALKKGDTQKGQTVEAHFADGQTGEYDLVLVGIGIIPNDGLARDAGLTCDGGIVVDHDGCTDDENIYAAGDCTIRPYVYHEGQGRLESVHNAIEQGKLCAASILRNPRPKEDCPWFWSDQYDVKLQIAGLLTGYDQYVVRGDKSQKKFAVFYLKQKTLIAVDAINSPPEFIMAKKMIMDRMKPDIEKLQDPNISIKEIAAG